jgi:hypothetical protein
MLADTVRPKASSVEGAEAHVPGEATRDDSSTSDHDEEKRVKEEEVVAVSSPVTGSAGVVGLSRNDPDAEAPTNHVEDEKVAPVEHSVETNEKGDTGNVEASNGDAEGEDEEANMVFPSGAPLALLTFGLCMAT